MKLSISNIGWAKENDILVYHLMQKYGFTGLEIAPTRIFPEKPYNKIKLAQEWNEKIKSEYGFIVPSIQSIWYGKQENLFRSEKERKSLSDYTKKAIEFAKAINCKNLVFGCPKNRNVLQDSTSECAIDFFRELGNYALLHNTVIGMEANPLIYNTNYINDTPSAFSLVREVESKGFMVNLDVGTMIQNEETVDIICGNVKLINHVHISEPCLKYIKRRQLHIELHQILKSENYDGFVSIEIGKVDDISLIEEQLDYVREIFG